MLDIFVYFILSSSVFSIILYGIKTLLSMVVTSIEISQLSHVSALDAFFSNRGWCSLRTYHGKPASECVTICIYRGWIIMAYKYNVPQKKSVYNIHIVGSKHLKLLHDMGLSMEEGVKVTYSYCPCPYRTETNSKYENRMITPNQMQMEIMEKTLESYHSNRNKNVIIYVYGDVGLGKSTIGYLMAEKLGGYVVANFDPTTPGLIIDDVIWDQPTIYSPCVLVIDDFDISVKHTIRDKSDKSHDSAISHAENKSTLTSLMDRLRNTPYLVVLLTSNHMSIHRESDFSAFFREKRIDFIFNIK
jgi:hypothetical protein